MDDKLDVRAVMEIEYSEELYKLIDFLNKNLKEKHIIFGLSKKNDTTAVVTIYQTE